MTKKRVILWIGIGLCGMAVLGALLFGRRVLNRIPPVLQQIVQKVTEGTTLPPPTANVFTPMDFGYEGDYLTCLTDESVLGIDVSKYQGDINWEKSGKPVWSL